METAGIPVLHPPDHDTAAVRCENRLRRIEVNPVIGGVVGFRDEAPAAFVTMTEQVEAPVAVVVFKILRQHVLGAGKQHVGAVQCEEIRTFPHQSEAVLILRQRPREGPVGKVVAPVFQNPSAFTRKIVGDQGAPAAFRQRQELWIAEVKAAPARREILLRKNRVAGIFFIVQSVTEGETLCLYFAVLSVLLHLDTDTCIHQKLPTVRQLDCTSGKAAVPVIIFVRGKCTGKILPVQKIRTYRVAPVHRPPVGIVGMILVEHVILPLIEGKTIRVIHPAGIWAEMKSGSVPCR